MPSLHCEIPLELRDQLTFILEENASLDIHFPSSLLPNGLMDSGTFFDDMGIEACLSFLWDPSVLGGVNQEGRGVIQPYLQKGNRRSPVLQHLLLTVVTDSKYKDLRWMKSRKGDS